jgi:hypothetical protein
MNIWDIFKKVGSRVIREVLPSGEKVIDEINTLMPTHKPLPYSSTGVDLKKAFVNLPPSEQLQLMEKEFDIEIEKVREENFTVRKMLELEQANPHSTRPYIAKGAFVIVAAVVLIVTLVWAYGVFSGNVAMVTAIMGSWQFIAAAIGPLVTLLWAYFGVLRSEHQQKLNAANGFNAQSGLLGTISDIIRK